MFFRVGKAASQQVEVLPAQAQEAIQKRPRLLFVDNLRVALTILVVIHHLAITYGGVGYWYYKEATTDQVTFDALSFLIIINQAFFMSLFFLISAYFMPESYDRKGMLLFLRDRLLRLGIPLVIYDVLLHPFTLYIGEGVPISFGQFLKLYLLHFPGIGNGPLWFILVLLMFTIPYLLWRRLTRKRPSSFASNTTQPTLALMLLFTLALAITTFLVWIWLPMSQPYQTSVVVLELPFFAQYSGLFIIGLIAYRRNWLIQISPLTGKVGLGVALGAIIAYPCLILPMNPSERLFLLGGLHWQAFIQALWESTVCVGMCVGLIVLFRQRLNQQGRWASFLSAQAYAVYVIHAPIIVCLAIALRGIHLYPLLKFALAVVIAVPLCFLCGYLIRKLPLARKIF